MAGTEDVFSQLYGEKGLLSGTYKQKLISTRRSGIPSRERFYYDLCSFELNRTRCSVEEREELQKAQALNKSQIDGNDYLIADGNKKSQEIHSAFKLIADGLLRKGEAQIGAIK